MLFKYNSQQWFNTDCIETVDDTGSEFVVTLKGGKVCRVYDREHFKKFLEPAPIFVSSDRPVFTGDYAAGEWCASIH